MFETTLARRCAPVLLGVKPAALFPRPDWWKARHTRFLALYGLCCEVAPRWPRRDLIFAYRPELLAPVLLEKPIPSALRSLGYPDASRLEDCALALSRRLAESPDFPHEIGFFLGYPPEDVLGFMEHGGKNCKLCGQWKVYGDVEMARALFSEFNSCTARLMALLHDGGSILDVGGVALAPAPPVFQQAVGAS